MPAPHIAVPEVPEQLREGQRRLQDKLELPREFPPAVLSEAEVAAQLPVDEHVDNRKLGAVMAELDDR